MRALGGSLHLLRHCGEGNNGKRQFAALRLRLEELGADDVLLPSLLIEIPQPLMHYVVAVSLFERITGQTPDTYLQECRPARRRCIRG